MGLDLFGFVQHWTPLAGRIEVAPLGVQKERGAAGTLDGWVVRKAGCYAIVWVQDGFLHGKRGVEQAENRQDPMVDHRSIAKVVRWGTRAEALAEAEGRAS